MGSYFLMSTEIQFGMEMGSGNENNENIFNATELYC